MLDSEHSQSGLLEDLNQRTSYLREWRQPQSKTPQTPQRKISIQVIRRNHNHVQQNKRSLRREASKRYGLRQWQGKHNLIHKVEYPINNGDHEAMEEAFLMSKLVFQEAAPLPYTVITLKGNMNKPGRSSNLLSSQIAKTQREIAVRRQAELQKVVTCRTQFKHNNKLLPSISIKRSQPQKQPATVAVPQQKLEKSAPKPSRRLSLSSFQHQQNIIKLIQF